MLKKIEPIFAKSVFAHGSLALMLWLAKSSWQPITHAMLPLQGSSRNSCLPRERAGGFSRVGGRGLSLGRQISPVWDWVFWVLLVWGSMGQWLALLLSHSIWVLPLSSRMRPRLLLLAFVIIVIVLCPNASVGMLVHRATLLVTSGWQVTEELSLLNSCLSELDGRWDTIIVACMD